MQGPDGDWLSLEVEATNAVDHALELKGVLDALEGKVGQFVVLPDAWLQGSS